MDPDISPPLVSPGYIVFSGVRRARGVQGLRVIIQSDRPSQYVDDRVEAFLHHMDVRSYKDCQVYTYKSRSNSVFIKVL